MEIVSECGGRKRSKVDMEAQLMFGLRSFFIYILFFLDDFSSLGSNLRFPLQQTPLGPTAKGRPSCKRGVGHLLLIYPSRGRQKTRTKQRKKKESNALHFELLAFTLHCCCPPLPIETRGRTRELSKRETKPKDDLTDYIMTEETLPDVFDRQSVQQEYTDVFF
ncbi:hypothetical protein ATANTOWER_004178 [Ataeniobius toweri]|uniref:Uncharacterized protein n=1 Tax=Ataeniobius toweri TaxID=208326 RepID=A0ABU7A495_9TELE|nr:hypothetical protein [Ataeniobius toweri]